MVLCLILISIQQMLLAVHNCSLLKYLPLEVMCYVFMSGERAPKEQKEAERTVIPFQLFKTENGLELNLGLQIFSFSYE